MRYTRNYVYTTVANAVRQSFQTANCTSRFTQTPASFPNVYIYELHHAPTRRGMHLKADDVQWDSVFEVQVTSNKETGAANEAYAVMDTVTEAMAGMYYRLVNQVPEDTGKKFYLISQYRRVVGGGDQTGG